MRRSAILNLLLIVSLLFAVSVQGADKPKYIFYFIGDGMGMNHVNLTEMYNAEVNGTIGIVPLAFTQFPYIGYATTFSANRGVTCSAAAGTALATGKKTKNGCISMDSTLTQPLTALSYVAKERGMKVAVISNNHIEHATPATFLANQPSRSNYHEMVSQIAASGFDFIGGSGIVTESDPKGKLDVPALEMLKRAGYDIYRGKDAVKSITDAKRVIAAQTSDKPQQLMAYVIDRKPEDMELADLTQKAIELLIPNKKGAFFMIEQGSIDWAAHINDGAALVGEVNDLNKNVLLALEVYKRFPKETLIIVTADHETGGLCLGAGSYHLNLKALSHQKVSKNTLTTELNSLRKEHASVTWEHVSELLSNRLGFGKEIKLSEKDQKRLKEQYELTFLKGDGEKVKTLYATDEPLASMAIAMLNKYACVGWLHGGHSANYVPIYAIGCGAHNFAGKMDNTDIAQKLTTLIKK
ncbi:MAG: alkaline phosphatase [Marinifilaceae bacterium]